MAVAADPRQPVASKPGDFQRHPTTGAPYVNHPTDVTRDGRPKRVIYGRPSGFGGSLDNPYSLVKWKERQLLRGLAAIRVDWSEHPDPDIDLLDQIAGRAHDAAGSSLAADRGTHIHLLCETCDRGDAIGDTDLIERGAALGVAAALQARIVDQWAAFRAALGVETVAVEGTVVHDGWQLAGTFDRLDRATRKIVTMLGPIALGATFIGDIKGLALDTPIPTPTGWSTIRAIEVGDEVIGSDGKPCNVVGKSEVRYQACHRITFADGTAVVADDDHCWVVKSGEHKPYRHRVLTTRELARSVFGSRGQRQHRVVNSEPLDLPDADLSLDPYLLGVWLGDGKHTSGEITKPAASGIWDEIRERGFKLGKPYIDKRTGCATITVLGMVTELRRLDVYSNKHVPDSYLRASRVQRLDLLRGLMDTDGCWNIARDRAVFCSTDKQLALAVYELVVSLGERAHLSEMRQTGFGLSVTAHNVEWAPSRFNPFGASDKADRAVVHDTGRNTNRVIVSVDRIPTVTTQCIAVDSHDNTYLCTESMIVTHNTGSLTFGSDGAPRYWIKYPVQLAAYADAVPYDTATDQRGVWPVRPHRKIALIYHYDLPRALNGELVDWSAIPVALAAGRAGGRAALASKQFGHRSDLFGQPIEIPDEPRFSPGAGEVEAPTPLAAMAASPADISDTAPNAALAATPDLSTGVAESGVGPEPASTSGAAATSAASDGLTVDDLRQLADEIGCWPDDVKQRLARVWPRGLAAPRQVREGVAAWGAVDLPVIQAAMFAAEAPWSTADHGRSEPVARPPLNTPDATVSDDGGPLDPRAVDALLASITDASIKVTMNVWLAEAKAAGVVWQPKIVGTVRSFEQARAAHRLATFVGAAPDDDRDMYARMIIGAAVDAAHAVDVTVGEIVGRLTIAEAHAVVAVVDDIDAGRRALTFSDDGAPLLAETAAVT